MKKQSTIERWPLAGVFVTLALMAGFIAWCFYQIEAREADLAEVALERNQLVLRTRLDGFIHEAEEDLREEAMAIRAMDTLSAKLLKSKWQPLLASHWSIMSIRLADERGNEVALYRKGDDMLLMETFEGCRNGPPVLMNLTAAPAKDTVGGVILPDTIHDPRQRIWFSKALESGSLDPVWTLRSDTSIKPILLQVSQLIRTSSTTGPHQVLMFDIDLARSDRLNSRNKGMPSFGSMLMDDSGRPLLVMQAHTDSVVKRAEQEAIAHWSQARVRRTYTFKSGGEQFTGMVVPFDLNGQQLLAGTLVQMATIGLWTDPERNAVIILACGLFLLIVLVFLLRRYLARDHQRMRKQQRKNRTLERRLEKALGERDVLNREVHHRVKNNLQVVSSLLNLQASRLDDEPVRAEFLRGKRRIDTIALVHHKLYGLADLRNVDLKLFFNGLVDALNEMHRPQSRTISHAIEVGGIQADQDTAIELGIILCELVGNAYQHAFPHATGGHITIDVHQVDGILYRLMVKNNGTQLPNDPGSGPGKLGLEIVDALASQLDGSFHIRTNGGVTFEVLFRMERGDSSSEAAFGEAEGTE